MLSTIITELDHTKFKHIDKEEYEQLYKKAYDNLYNKIEEVKEMDLL